MSNNITKADLVRAAAEAAEISQASAEKALNSIIASVQEAMVDGKTVTLVGFGSFTTGARSARKGRNPQTGEEIDIPPSTVVKFRPGKDLKEAVNPPPPKKKKKRKK